MSTSILGVDRGLLGGTCSRRSQPDAGDPAGELKAAVREAALYGEPADVQDTPGRSCMTTPQSQNPIANGEGRAPPVPRTFRAATVLAERPPATTASDPGGRYRAARRSPAHRGQRTLLSSRRTASARPPDAPASGGPAAAATCCVPVLFTLSRGCRALSARPAISSSTPAYHRSSPCHRSAGTPSSRRASTRHSSFIGGGSRLRRKRALCGPVDAAAMLPTSAASGSGGRCGE